MLKLRVFQSSDFQINTDYYYLPWDDKQISKKSFRLCIYYFDFPLIFVFMPFLSCEHDTSRTHFFNFRTIVQFDSGMNWFELGGQRSLWPHETHHMHKSYCTLSVGVGKRSILRKLTTNPGTTHTTVVSRMTNHTLFSDRQLVAVPEETHLNVFVLNIHSSAFIISHVSQWTKRTYEWEMTGKDAEHAVALHRE